MHNKLLLLISLITMLFIASEPVAAQDESTDCDEGYRLVEHKLGESCIPENPQRVIAIDTGINELMLILGMEPIATVDFVAQTYALMHPDMADTYNEATEDLPDMGFPPNFEVILDANPDLIIAPHDFFGLAIYNQMSETVPIVLYDYDPEGWRERLELAADYLNATEEVDELLAGYDARVAELQAALQENGADKELSLVRLLPDQIGLVVAGTMAQAVLDDVGILRPQAQNYDYARVLEELNGRPEIIIQREELLLADGDVIFYFSGTGDISELVDNPLWEAIPAVQAGTAHQVGYYWWGESLLSAHDVLDDLFEYIAETDPILPNPYKNGLPTTDNSALDDCADGFHAVEDAQGTICIPANPQRIAALDPFTFEAMLALDAPMIATPGIYMDELLVKFPQFELDLVDVIDVGLPVNIELLLETEPDVILCRQTACSDQYEQLSQIAPTVMYANQSSADWQESTRFYAEALQMQDALASLEADYAARIDTFQTLLGDETPTISVMRVQPGRLRLYFGQSFAGVVYQDAGLTNPERQLELIDENVETAQLYQLSLEELPLADADFVFVYATDGLNSGQAPEYLAEVQSSPLWRTLTAVQNDQLQVVDNYWFTAGYIAAHAIIDDLFAFVLDQEPTVRNPFIAE